MRIRHGLHHDVEILKTVLSLFNRITCFRPHYACGNLKTEVTISARRRNLKTQQSLVWICV